MSYDLMKASDFSKKLKSNSLTRNSILHGMVKETDVEGVILFTTHYCEKWRTIPFNLIKHIQYIDDVRCKDHYHPFVRIVLNSSIEGNSEANALLNLLQDALDEEASGGNDKDESMLSIEDESPRIQTSWCEGAYCRARNGRSYSCKYHVGRNVYCSNCCLS